MFDFFKRKKKTPYISARKRRQMPHYLDAEIRREEARLSRMEAHFVDRQNRGIENVEADHALLTKRKLVEELHDKRG